MKNIALMLRYDGTNYHGWQSQKNGRTVQEVVSNAIKKLTGNAPLPELHGVGRTDAGVHGLNYVANFLTESRIPPERFPYALKQHLPADISVLAATEAREEFHARFDCIEKEYIYRMYVSKTPDPFLIHRAYFSPVELDIRSMQSAAAKIIGKHDFACFQATGSVARSSVRNVTGCSVTRMDDGTIAVRVSADGFLYNMVRIIAGTLYYVGLGKIASEAIDHMLLSGNRLEAGVTLPPHGLYLHHACYPADSFIGGITEFD